MKHAIGNLVTHLRSLGPIRLTILGAGIGALVLSGGVGAYALQVRTEAVAEQKATAARTVASAATLEKLNDRLAAGEATATATAPASTTVGQPAVTTTPQPSSSSNKTYAYTDGLSGQTTTYTEGCVTKRPGYPDADCDGRAGAASMPTPTVPTTPTHLLSVRPGFNTGMGTCSSIGAPSAYFDISDARGGLPITFHFEFDNDTMTLSDGSTPVSSQNFTITTRYEPTAPYLQGSDSWYDNSAIWLTHYPISHSYRVHVTSPVDMVSDWKSIYFAEAWTTC